MRRFYIQTLRDKGVTPELQKRMVERLPCARVVSMDTSHSPFLSAPGELAAHLVALAR